VSGTSHRFAAWLPRHAAIAAIIATLLSLSAACVRQGDTRADAAHRTHPDTVFHLLRHAEKASDDPKDPSLTDVGHARAERLAMQLRDEKIAAVYATAYRRTQATAAPTAGAHGLSIITYDAAQSMTEWAAELRKKHRRKTIVVIGHSNTIGPMASALCACEVMPLRDDEFDRWITIRIDDTGEAILQTRRY
jgi:broad specificity phosphatase PhoE